MEQNDRVFLKSIEFYRRMRLRPLELRFDSQCPDDGGRLNELHERLTELLGKHKSLLAEYGDLLIARYNTDVFAFYDEGFTDCQQLYRFFRETLQGKREFPPLEEKTAIDLIQELTKD